MSAVVDPSWVVDPCSPSGVSKTDQGALGWKVSRQTAIVQDPVAPVLAISGRSIWLCVALADWQPSLRTLTTAADEWCRVVV